MFVKKGDTVMIISGDEKGKKGKVIEVSPKEGKVIIEGRNMVKKHVRPRQAGQPGGIIDAPGAIYASKVMVICPKCNKPTRVGTMVRPDPERPGKVIRERKCRNKGCGEAL
ncbi:MAG: 50S ribosomal protein L24 [Clostridia bacterium]|nr:50S ribosomal protein L24 [Clostridia bacterium]